MSSSHSLAARLRYRFDNAMARGPIVVVAYLAVLTLVIVAIAALIIVLGGLSFDGESDPGFIEAMWQSILRTLDPGTFSGDAGWPIRIVTFAVTLTGLFLVVSLIGLIANAVDSKVEELRRGRSPVVESGHVLILGWSPQVPRIIGELIIANESEKRGVVVILASEDKVVMEDTLKETLEDLRTTRIVVRSGNPALPVDLERAGVATARSIVAVRPQSAEGGAADAEVIKAVLAVRSLDPTLHRAHIVAELDAADNSEIIRSVTAGRVLTVSSDRVVAEVTAQACLQPGLSAVFTDLLDFDGDEIYFTPADALAGKTYRDALLSYETCSVIGHKSAAGKVALNPDPTTVLAQGDELIVVAEDDSVIRISPVSANGGGAAGAPITRGQPAPVGLTIVGWSSFGAKVLKELDEFLPPNSMLTIVVDQDLVDPQSVTPTMQNATLSVQGGTGGPDDIRRLAAGEPPDQVIVLGYRDALSIDEADARTLLTLLTLRTVWPARGTAKHVRIVAELLDQRNLVLADPDGVDDLIVSNALSSLLMAQLAEHADLEAVFDDLFDAEGAVLEMRPAAELVGAGPTRFADVVAAGGATGASVLGYRIGATGAVVMNPAKTEQVALGPDDHVVLISG
ncbi:MAG TPA: NAD-binding protein [Acidimicrobiales bacterium]|nr:NAD-binding protein [Acidimicrobiales bacterium]